MKNEADELFRKLGYEKMEDEICQCCIFYKTINHGWFKEEPKFIFLYKTKKICFDIKYVSMEELEAIKKKCEELGWKI